VADVVTGRGGGNTAPPDISGAETKAFQSGRTRAAAASQHANAGVAVLMVARACHGIERPAHRPLVGLLGIGHAQ